MSRATWKSIFFKIIDLTYGDVDRSDKIEPGTLTDLRGVLPGEMTASTAVQRIKVLLPLPAGPCD